MCCKNDKVCGAAICDGKVMMQDFCFCAEPRSGPNQCLVMTHKDRATKCIPLYRGGNVYHVVGPGNGMQQAFLRPCLLDQQLKHFCGEQYKSAREALMVMELTHRTWKLLLEAFTPLPHTHCKACHLIAVGMLRVQHHMEMIPQYAPRHWTKARRWGTPSSLMDGVR